MICVRLYGGLGNQMFQYAFGLALALENKTELLLDTSHFEKEQIKVNHTFRPFELNLFNLNTKEADLSDIKKLKPFLYRVINVISLYIGLQGIQTSKYFIENGSFYNESIKIIEKQCYVSGYWQSYKYFQDIELIIRNNFKFPKNSDVLNIERMEKITNSNSISLHIRRSDYVKNKHHDIHGICSIEFYNESIKYLAERIENPTIFVFSDDIEWAIQNITIAHPVEFITGNTGEKSYLDMQLMSLCKHNIIANSSFSWWGAWLNSYKQKIVIAPQKWYLDEKINSQTGDLIPREWIRL